MDATAHAIRCTICHGDAPQEAVRALNALQSNRAVLAQQHTKASQVPWTATSAAAAAAGAAHELMRANACARAGPQDQNGLAVFRRYCDRIDLDVRDTHL